MTRNDFVKRGLQAGLLALLGLIILSLKGRIATGPNCSICPDQGRCLGKSQCKR